MGPSSADSGDRSDVCAALRVVIADDAADMRLLMRISLECNGFRVVGEAADGAEAVALVGATAPDVVVLDLGMPLMGGMEAARLIRDRAPAVKIVVLSGFAVGRMPSDDLAQNVDLYIEKGFPPSWLGDRIMALFQGTKASS